MNGINVMNGQLSNGIYILSQPVSIMYTTNKHTKIDNVSESYLWYCRLGHVTRIGFTG